MDFVTRRIYDPPDAEAGFRVLVDRLWPRGVSKEEARLDLWLKDVAPSPELRRWFDHRADRFAEFTTRYEAELAQGEALRELEEIGREHARVILLYGAKDAAVNHAVVLARLLNG